MRISTYSFLVVISAAVMSNNLYAADRDPCQSDGTLKGWAIKQGYSAEDCGSLSNPDGGGSTDGSTSDNNNICEGDKLKGWARKAGYSADDCVVSEPDPTPENQLPVVTILAPVSGYTGDDSTPVTLTADANDSEDGDLSGSVQWSSSLDGSVADGSMLSVGTHVITAMITDSNGASASAQVSIDISETVIPNTAPSISILTPENGLSVDNTTMLTFSGSAIDQEDGDLSNNIQWSSSVDGAIANITTLSIGTHIITASVSDSEGVSATTQINLEITELVAEPQPLPSKIRIAWSAPTTREDGTALPASEIAGYEIYMVSDSGGENIIVIDGGSVTSHQTEVASGDAYHFAISAVDVNGMQSALTDPYQLVVE